MVDTFETMVLNMTRTDPVIVLLAASGSTVQLMRWYTTSMLAPVPL